VIDPISEKSRKNGWHTKVNSSNELGEELRNAAPLLILNYWILLGDSKLA